MFAWFRYLPIVLTIVAVALFVLSIKPVIRYRRPARPLRHRRGFHDNVPLRAHALLGLGTLALVWAQVLPLLFVAAAEAGIDKLIEALTDGDAGGDPPWTAILLSDPAILVFGFIVSFWLARGLKAITFILKYRPQDVGGAAVGARGGTARYRSAAAR